MFPEGLHVSHQTLFFKYPRYSKRTRTFQKFRSKWFCFRFPYGKIDMVLLNNTVFQNTRPRFPKNKYNISFVLSGLHDDPWRREWHHDMCHDMGFEGHWWFLGVKWHDMVCDTSRSETRRVGSGRPRGGCYRGWRGGQECIAPVMKTGTNGVVGLCHLQWFCRCW